jgi:hypothetical protein
MKWIAWVLLTLGTAEIAAGALYRRDIQSREDEWMDARRQIDHFERRVSIAELARDKEKAVLLTIPDDRQWRLVTRKLPPQFVIRRLDPDFQIPWQEPPTESPYETWTADTTVNGVVRAMYYSFEDKVWRLAGPVQLGDRIDVKLKSTAKPVPYDKALLLGISLRGEKEDHPGVGWDFERMISKIIQWTGVGFCAMGLVFLVHARREAAAISLRRESGPQF